MYIITEFADGGSLDKKIESLHASGNKLSEKEAFRYFVMLCLGLDSIHKQGFVHRDISTKNLFLKNFGGGSDLIIIGDFGLARS